MSSEICPSGPSPLWRYVVHTFPRAESNRVLHAFTETKASAATGPCTAPTAVHQHCRPSRRSTSSRVVAVAAPMEASWKRIVVCQGRDSQPPRPSRSGVVVVEAASGTKPADPGSKFQPVPYSKTEQFKFTLTLLYQRG